MLSPPRRAGRQKVRPGVLACKRAGTIKIHPVLSLASLSFLSWKFSTLELLVRDFYEGSYLFVRVQRAATHRAAERRESELLGRIRAGSGASSSSAGSQPIIGGWRNNSPFSPLFNEDLSENWQRCSNVSGPCSHAYLLARIKTSQERQAVPWLGASRVASWPASVFMFLATIFIFLIKCV